jgi:aspartate aminotransferase
MLRVHPAPEILMTSRIATLQQSLPFFEWYGSSPHQERGGKPGVVDLLFGNPHDMPIPAYVEALQRHVVPQHPGWFAYMFDDEGATGTAADGLRRHTGMDWNPDDIAMTNGGWGAIAVGIRALVEPGDEVIYYDPPWFFYDLLIRGAEATPVVLRLEPPRFSPDPAALAAAITHRTRAVLLNTPHNPTGRILDDAELDAVAEVLRAASDRHGRPIYLLSDEAYRLIALDGRRAPSPAEHYERTLVLYSYGKQLLAPGQRIGYLALSPRIPDEERATLREAVRTAQFVNSYSWPNALLQRALPDIADLVVDIAALERRRDRLVPALAELGYEPTTPEGTFYVLARSPIEDDVAFAARLAEDDVFVLPGTTINLPGWFRISLTASDEMIEASIARFAAAREPVRA